MNNTVVYRANQKPNTVFTIHPELLPILRPALAHAFPVAFSRANHIEKGTHTIIEIHLNEEEAELVRREIVKCMVKYQYHPN